MYLDKIVTAQKRGETKGIVSICSSHPYVLKQGLKIFAENHFSEKQGRDTLTFSPLIEATCNQVNQYGGYTGMTPVDFVKYIRGIAEKNGFPFGNITLGGDHLGPSAWQNEPAIIAMGKAEVLIRDYVMAGFTKIHLDCSMRLSDDPSGTVELGVTARRAAKLARIAEMYGNEKLRYVIGTEVPIPGGAKTYEHTVNVTKVEDVQQTIESTRDEFSLAGLQSAWDRVIAVVVQPGMEFGDDFVLPYQPEAAQELSNFIESQPIVYEAHSTDYQTYEALENLVRDHFAILKVGPALTFAFREAVFALAALEDELIPFTERSNIISIVDNVMLEKPLHWIKYYQGSEVELAVKRKYSLSDRIRYYWTDSLVQQAFEKLISNLNQNPLNLTLMKQYEPDIYAITAKSEELTPDEFLDAKIHNVLADYYQACNPK